jgi:hypothetical protein
MYRSIALGTYPDSKIGKYFEGDDLRPFMTNCRYLNTEIEILSIVFDYRLISASPCSA